MNFFKFGKFSLNFLSLPNPNMPRQNNRFFTPTSLNIYKFSSFFI